MLCTISIMEKPTSNRYAKSIQNDYKYEISLYKSKQYSWPEKEAKSKENDLVDDQSAAHDDKYHSTVTTHVFVVTTKLIQGDDYKFRGLQKKLLQHGAVIFKGFP
eukprot:803245_1